VITPLADYPCAAHSTASRRRLGPFVQCSVKQRCVLQFKILATSLRLHPCGPDARTNLPKYRWYAG
jgi:hypothetical protein